MPMVLVGQTELNWESVSLVMGINLEQGPLDSH